MIHDTNNDELNDQPDSMVRTEDEPFVKSIPFLHDYEPTSALAEMEASKNFLAKIGCSLPNADNGSSEQDILDPFQRDIQVFVKCKFLYIYDWCIIRERARIFRCAASQFYEANNTTYIVIELRSSVKYAFL